MRAYDCDLKKRILIFHRPHWPKLWEAVPDVYPYLHRAYGDRLVRFNRIRKDQDPKDMFVNRTFEKLVGDL